MSPFLTASLNYLADNWDIAIERGLPAANLIGVNQNTLKTRIAQGNAAFIRDTEGRQRASIEFTGRHMVRNMIADRFTRFGMPFEEATEESAKMIELCDLVEQQIINSPHNIEAIIRVDLDADGNPISKWFSNFTEVESFTGDATLVIPIGTMVTRLAAALFAKHSPTAMHKLMEA